LFQRLSSFALIGVWIGARRRRRGGGEQSSGENEQEDNDKCWG
jgi:uncharacterized membrane protein